MPVNVGDIVSVSADTVMGNVSYDELIDNIEDTLISEFHKTELALVLSIVECSKEAKDAWGENHDCFVIVNGMIGWIALSHLSSFVNYENCDERSKVKKQVQRR